MNESNFQHILRVLNTNLDGKIKVMFALTSIKGVGRRFSNVACKKAEVDLNKRAGELTAEEVERLVTIVQNPRQFKVRRPPSYACALSRFGVWDAVVVLPRAAAVDVELAMRLRHHGCGAAVLAVAEGGYCGCGCATRRSQRPLRRWRRRRH